MKIDIWFFFFYKSHSYFIEINMYDNIKYEIYIKKYIYFWFDLVSDGFRRRYDSRSNDHLEERVGGPWVQTRQAYVWGKLIVVSLLSIIGRVSDQFGLRSAAGNEKRREIAGPEGRGATSRGGSASRAGSQAKCCRFQSQEAHSG